MQVEPMRPILKAPGTKLLKRKCDELLSNLASKFNLRRSTEGTWPALVRFVLDDARARIGEDKHKIFAAATAAHVNWYPDGRAGMGKALNPKTLNPNP